MSTLVIVFLIGCQQTPTKVYNKHKVDTEILKFKASKPLVITKKTVILDVRSSFDYSMSHFQEAIHLDPDDFYDRRGQLKADLYKEARRLARKGLSPDTPVIIGGNGAAPEGKEGRLAFVLLYLGFKDVQVAHLKAFNLRYTQDMPQPRKNKPIWKPVLVDSLIVTNKDLKNLIKSKEKIFYLDVRTKNEYLRSLRVNRGQVDIGAIHIPWDNFYTDEGRPNFAMAKKLRDIGIEKTSKIIVISENGLRSASVTTALLSLGLVNVANAVEGFQALNKQ